MTKQQLAILKSAAKTKLKGEGILGISGNEHVNEKRKMYLTPKAAKKK